RAQPLGVAGGDPGPRFEEPVQTGELRDPDGAENVGEPVVQARMSDLEVATGLDPVVAHTAKRPGEERVVGGDGAALAGGDDLPRVEREAGEGAKAAARPLLA